MLGRMPPPVDSPLSGEPGPSPPVRGRSPLRARGALPTAGAPPPRRAAPDRTRRARRQARAKAAFVGPIDAVVRDLRAADPAARAAALRALARRTADPRRELAIASGDPAGLVRRTAAELLARDTTDSGRRLLVALLFDADSLVVEEAAASLGERRELEAVGALSRIARFHDDPLCREAAVAALGAIGDPGGFPAVAAATEGPPALRRRALVALAGFDAPELAPEITAVLEQHLTDRDWQARQAAADLLTDRTGELAGQDD